MAKKFDKEVLFGGIFGIIAVVAAIGEMIANGLSTAAILGAAKDIAGTLVAVMVFAFAIKKIIGNNNKSLSKILTQELDSFEKNYSPLIFKVSNFEKMKNEKYEQGFCILKDFSQFIKMENISDETRASYSSRSSHKTAKFIDLPSISEMLRNDFKVCFRTLTSCKYDGDFLEDVKTRIAFKYKEYGYTATTISNGLIVEVPAIKSKDDIDTLISLFEIILVCFQIGNKGIKQ